MLIGSPARSFSGPTDAEVADVLDQVHHRVRRLLRRRGRWPEEDSSPSDPVAEQRPRLAEYASASIQGRVASGRGRGVPCPAPVGGREPLCRYLLRPPLALELIEKLTLLIPPPRVHTLRFRGHHRAAPPPDT